MGGVWVLGGGVGFEVEVLFVGGVVGVEGQDLDTGRSLVSFFLRSPDLGLGCGLPLRIPCGLGLGRYGI
jgi:hypothetical protein